MMKINKKYIHDTQTHNLEAPSIIVPYLIELINPKSVIDVGCGLGSWLYVFKEYGINNILGIEGEHLKRDLLYIDNKDILIADLEKPLEIQKKFDLVISLEVGEHISNENSNQFVNSLISLGDLIIFSNSESYTSFLARCYTNADTITIKKGYSPFAKSPLIRNNIDNRTASFFNQRFNRIFLTDKVFRHHTDHWYFPERRIPPPHAWLMSLNPAMTVKTGEIKSSNKIILHEIKIVEAAK